jgi:uncharacterized protein (UPF0335 family)
MSEDFDGSNEKKPDLSEMFDLTRDMAVKRYVDQFEDLMRSADAIKADIKQLADDAKEQLFTPREIKAMKQIAAWRKDDKGMAAQEMLASLKRVSNATGYDLFAWAEKTL